MGFYYIVCIYWSGMSFLQDHGAAHNHTAGLYTHDTIEARFYHGEKNLKKLRSLRLCISEF